MRSPFQLGALAHKSLADIVRRPERSLLVTLGIMVGVAGLTAINVANDAMHRALAYTSNETQLSNITIYAQRIDPTIVPQLAAVPNVAAVQISTQYATRWQIAQTPGHAAITISAYPDLSHIALNPFQVTRGRLPDVGEIVMDESSRVFQPVAIGDTVTLETPYGPADVRVVGLSRTLGTFGAAFAGAAQAYMSAAGLDQLAAIAGPNVVEASVRNVTQLDQTTSALYDLLTRRRVVVQGSSTDPTPFGTGIVDALFTILRALSLVALLITAFLIINMVTALVAEQTAIIGTMKAIGGARASIMRGYLVSVLWYGAAGTALGLALGIFGGYHLTLFLTSVITLDLGPFQLAPWVALVSLLLGIGVPLLAAFAPLWRGTAITVHEAMAAYGISASTVSAGAGHPRPGWLSARWAWIPQTTRLSLRSITRKRGRAALTVLALTLSGAAFLAAQTTAYSLSLRQSQLDTLYPWDIRVALNTPQSITRLRDELTQVPNVAVAEEQPTDLVRTPWGTLIVQGFSPYTQMYQHPMLVGRWLNDGEDSAIVLSDLAARKASLSVGDTLTLSAPAGAKSWTVIGVARDPTASPMFIGTAFVTPQGLAGFTQRPADEASTFLIQAQDRSQAAVNTLATTLDQRLSTEGLAPSVVTHQQDDQTTQRFSQILSTLLYAIAFIVALVGMLGLATTLTTSVVERRREIGILRSMGATGRQVSAVFWVEGIALALLAWGLGTLIGTPGAIGVLALISQVLLPIAFAFDATVLATMLGFLLVMVTIASYGPALSAARLRIAVILRYE